MLAHSVPTDHNTSLLGEGLLKLSPTAFLRWKDQIIFNIVLYLEEDKIFLLLYVEAKIISLMISISEG